MKRLITACCLALSVPFHNASAGMLKSVVYDFDGLAAGQVNLPEGDYRINDLTYKIAVNPLGKSAMLGDRVLQLDLNWKTGNGTFGRGISRFIEFDPAADIFNFYFYNPMSNPGDVPVQVVLAEDDDGTNSFSIIRDDIWIKELVIPRGPAWQLISIPLADFKDGNPDGNGIFDASFQGGMLLTTEFRFLKKDSLPSAFYLDMICFSDGPMPHGAGILDLPPMAIPGKCPLGAYEKKDTGMQYTIPGDIENLFAYPRKIRYVNWFLQFSMDGSTVPNKLPGDEVTKLLANGYRPIITWEPLFSGYSRLDPVQPRLKNIIDGDFDVYINSFADKMRAYDDTVIIRFMHEFEGDWYPWSLVHNDTSTRKYIAAYRKVVEMFRARGAAKVKWMWCLNSDYAPYKNFNWVVKAYPGDAYVDIVATDIYNNHFPVNSPWWFSFRYKAAESYYYLRKYFSQKPLIICEVGCRERGMDEDPASQTKADWLAGMDNELQSNFSAAKGLVFFSGLTECDWRINSSAAALGSMEANIWKDDYYFEERNSTHTHDLDYDGGGFVIYPNPTTGLFTLEYCFHDLQSGYANVEIIDARGNVVYRKQLLNINSCGMEMIRLDKDFPHGMYIINVSSGGKMESKKIMLNP